MNVKYINYLNCALQTEPVARQFGAKQHIQFDCATFSSAPAAFPLISHNKSFPPRIKFHHLPFTDLRIPPASPPPPPTHHTQKQIKTFWMKASRCACNSINVTQYTSAQSVLFLGKATCFDWKLAIFRPLQHLCYQMLCPVWDPIVFTIVECI